VTGARSRIVTEDHSSRSTSIGGFEVHQYLDATAGGKNDQSVRPNMIESP